MVSLIPAYFINRYLLKLIQPKRSGLRLIQYLIIVLAAAFLYTFLISWVLLKYVAGLGHG